MDKMAKFKLALGEDSWVLDLGTMKVSEAEQCESMTGWDAVSYTNLTLPTICSV